MVSASPYILPHVVIMSHHILHRFTRFTWSAYIAPCGQSVSPYIALIHTVHMVSMYQNILPHVVRMYHDMLYRFTRFTWSAYIAPCGQSVSPYIALIHVVHMVSASPYILPHVVRMYHDMLYRFILSTYSECLTICCRHGSVCITTDCPHRQYVSRYGARIEHINILSHITYDHICDRDDRCVQLL